MKTIILYLITLFINKMKSLIRVRPINIFYFFYVPYLLFRNILIIILIMNLNIIEAILEILVQIIQFIIWLNIVDNSALSFNKNPISWIRNEICLFFRFYKNIIENLRLILLKLCLYLEESKTKTLW